MICLFILLLLISVRLGSDNADQPGEPFDQFLQIFMRPRKSGSEGNLAVRADVERWAERNGVFFHKHEFSSQTVAGEISFANLLLVSDPEAVEFFVLGAHYDSKAHEPGQDGAVFLGATDSAVSCALILELCLKAKSLAASQVGFVFALLDGEEAIGPWTESTALFGSRKLAEDFSLGLQLPGGPLLSKSNIKGVVILDLLGAKDPTIHRLGHRGLFEAFFDAYIENAQALQKKSAIQVSQVPMMSAVVDDDAPFRERGFSTLLVIPIPFPWCWHELTDDRRCIDSDVVDEFRGVFGRMIAKLSSGELGKRKEL